MTRLIALTVTQCANNTYNITQVRDIVLVGLKGDGRRSVEEEVNIA